MSTELQQQSGVMDAEIVSAEMIKDAVANCFVTIGDMVLTVAQVKAIASGNPTRCRSASSLR